MRVCHCLRSRGCWATRLPGHPKPKAVAKTSARVAAHRSPECVPRHFLSTCLDKRDAAWTRARGRSARLATDRAGALHGWPPRRSPPPCGVVGAAQLPAALCGRLRWARARAYAAACAGHGFATDSRAEGGGAALCSIGGGGNRLAAGPHGWRPFGRAQRQECGRRRRPSRAPPRRQLHTLRRAITTSAPPMVF